MKVKYLTLFLLMLSTLPMKDATLLVTYKNDTKKRDKRIISPIKRPKSIDALIKGQRVRSSLRLHHCYPYLPRPSILPPPQGGGH